MPEYIRPFLMFNLSLSLRPLGDFSVGKMVMEALLETKSETILQSIHGLRGSS
jgi:hypothetical protein